MDIVDRLREMADLFEAQQAPHNLVLHLRTGADEIDRLRAGGCARDQGLTQHCAEAAGLTARVEELEGALKRMIELVMHANPEAFSNGVTDSSGTIDEGDVIAGRIIDEARAALTKGERTPSFGDFVEGCDYLPVPSTKGESHD